MPPLAQMQAVSKRINGMSQHSDDVITRCARVVVGAVMSGNVLPRDLVVAVLDEAARSGWQPIETAPKDGSWVLLTGGTVEYGWDADQQPPAVVGQARGQGWQFAWYDSGYYGEYEKPSHWMPVPAPG